MERAEGALFRTAETVPGVNPTCWATTLSVTTPDFWRDFLICPMFGIAPIASDQHKELLCQTTLYQKRTTTNVNLCIAPNFLRDPCSRSGIYSTAKGALMKAHWRSPLFMLIGFSAACGGGSMTSPPPPPTVDAHVQIAN